MTHPKPPGAAAKPANPKPAAKSDKPPVAAQAASPGTPPAPRSALAFPLLLTVVAVLPLAMGLGAVRLKGSTSVAKPKPVETHQIQEVKDPNPTFSVGDHRDGDELFLKRRYDLALRNYESICGGDVGQLPVELLYRTALCEEGLGRWSEAVEHLRIVAQTHDRPVLKAAALFGQARVWLRRNEPEKAASLLRHLVFQSETESVVPAKMAREIAFLLPIALAKSSTSEVRFADRVDLTNHGLAFNGALETAFEWADQLSFYDPLIADADLPANAYQVHWKRSSAETTGAKPIESQKVDVYCQHQSLRTILEDVAEQSGLHLDWSDMADDHVLDHPVCMTIENQPLCALLTAACSEMQSTWNLKDDRLVISRSRLNRDDARGMIARALLSLTRWVPNDRYADEARFALAEIAQSECCLAESANLFAVLSASNASPLAVRAAANASDNYYRIRDFASARAQLKHVVDGAPGSQLQAHCMVRLGQLLLDLGETQDAVFQLRRATDINHTHDVQAKAAILLGLAYLIQNKHEDAAQAVFVKKFQFDEPESRNAAAFVTAYARWKFTTGEIHQRESSYLYRSLLAINSDLDWIGQTGRVLIGRAYLELGFGDIMAEMFSKMLENELTESTRDEISFTLANYEMENDRPDAAKQLWSKLSFSRSTRLATRSRLRLAAIALIETRPKDCLELCELIQTDDEVSVMDIQRLMGRAFEQLGEDTLAARCYAGQYKRP